MARLIAESSIYDFFQPETSIYPVSDSHVSQSIRKLIKALQYHSKSDGVKLEAGLS